MVSGAKTYSGEEVTKAGKALTDPKLEQDEQRFNWAFSVLFYWRSEHDSALNLAFDDLLVAAKDVDKNAVVAKRLKRHASIKRKLCYEPGMTLRNMQDVAGCRAIVTNTKKLKSLVRNLKKSASFRGSDGLCKYKDYIQYPQESGYRGYHLVATYPGLSKKKRKVEVQIRTALQHYWATALEIVDLFTGQALKSSKGSADWTKFFFEVSEQFNFIESIHMHESATAAVLFERIKRQLDSIPSGKKIGFLESNAKAFELIQKLGVVKKFSMYAGSLQAVGEHIDSTKVDGYVLIKIYLDRKQVESTIFNSGENGDAERAYTNAEKEHPTGADTIVAMVSTNAVGGVREAYPNFFADSRKFLEYLECVIKINRHYHPTVKKSLVGDWEILKRLFGGRETGQ